MKFSTVIVAFTVQQACNAAAASLSRELNRHNHTAADANQIEAGIEHLYEEMQVTSSTLDEMEEELKEEHGETHTMTMADAIAEMEAHHPDMPSDMLFPNQRSKSYKHPKGSKSSKTHGKTSKNHSSSSAKAVKMEKPGISMSMDHSISHSMSMPIVDSKTGKAEANAEKYPDMSMLKMDAKTAKYPHLSMPDAKAGKTHSKSGKANHSMPMVSMSYSKSGKSAYKHGENSSKSNKAGNVVDTTMSLQMEADDSGLVPPTPPPVESTLPPIGGDDTTVTPNTDAGDSPTTEAPVLLVTTTTTVPENQTDTDSGLLPTVPPVETTLSPLTEDDVDEEGEEGDLDSVQRTNNKVDELIREEINKVSKVVTNGHGGTEHTSHSKPNHADEVQNVESLKSHVASGESRPQSSGKMIGTVAAGAMCVMSAFYYAFGM
eukprot:CAMPEP_0171334946 /NCGR_PEP_ID=MMETSP0878-20121228/5029_1 /TAXON_ID=67004 /ORGANISM="Thalassiosira weissflogii, Strain CCMP1336" /LENGTH=431 /DNA_ID=CAMNT_0011836155 /DNA_START=131 /DNA_END=1426 /DNA_ORIENTATION=+